MSKATLPALFIGHGSPMNAVENNSYTRMLDGLGKSLPAPTAILCISAHWETSGTFVTSSAEQKIIYDFRGFPEELYAVKYPAKGSPELAGYITEKISGVGLAEWGLDHGTWAVLRHLYPQATVPILQLSLDMTKPAVYHYQLGQKLKPLRDEGVLIVGSGNVVHNLREFVWEIDAPIRGWAKESDQWVKEKTLNNDVESLIKLDHPLAVRSIPTPEHYYPYLYILGCRGEDEKLEFIFEEIQNAAIAMRSIRIG